MWTGRPLALLVTATCLWCTKVNAEQVIPRYCNSHLMAALAWAPVQCFKHTTQWGQQYKHTFNSNPKGVPLADQKNSPSAFNWTWPASTVRAKILTHKHFQFSGNDCCCGECHPTYKVPNIYTMQSMHTRVVWKNHFFSHTKSAEPTTHQPSR